MSVSTTTSKTPAETDGRGMTVARCPHAGFVGAAAAGNSPLYGFAQCCAHKAAAPAED